MDTISSGTKQHTPGAPQHGNAAGGAQKGREDKRYMYERLDRAGVSYELLFHGFTITGLSSYLWWQGLVNTSGGPKQP